MKAVPALLDHLVLATPDLAATVDDFTRRTGVAPVPDGALLSWRLTDGCAAHPSGLPVTPLLSVAATAPD